MRWVLAVVFLPFVFHGVLVAEPVNQDHIQRIGQLIVDLSNEIDRVERTTGKELAQAKGQLKEFSLQILQLQQQASSSRTVVDQRLNRIEKDIQQLRSAIALTVTANRGTRPLPSSILCRFNAGISREFYGNFQASVLQDSGDYSSSSNSLPEALRRACQLCRPGRYSGHYQANGHTYTYIDTRFCKLEHCYDEDRQRVGSWEDANRAAPAECRLDKTFVVTTPKPRTACHRYPGNQCPQPECLTLYAGPKMPVCLSPLLECSDYDRYVNYSGGSYCPSGRCRLFYLGAYSPACASVDLPCQDYSRFVGTGIGACPQDRCRVVWVAAYRWSCEDK